MSDKENKSCSCSTSGCMGFLMFMFFVWAWFWGLPTFWGVLEIDLFWPAVRLNNITYLGK